MKQLLTLLLLANICQAQQGIMFTDPSMKGNINPKTEKIIGDTILSLNAKWNKKKGEYVYYASLFKIVQYDYGNPPAHAGEIMRWFLCEGFPTEYKEWKVEKELVLSINGDRPWDYYKVSFICESHKSLLSKYSYDVSITMDGISVKQNKDTTDKYFKLEYK
jgi:hypothetical protein